MSQHRHLVELTEQELQFLAVAALIVTAPTKAHGELAAAIGCEIANEMGMVALTAMRSKLASALESIPQD